LLSLAIDTSMFTGWISLIVFSSHEQSKVNEVALSESSHAENLVPALQSMLKQSCVQLKDVDELLYGLGPGSFTGLRIGASVVAGLKHGCSEKGHMQVRGLSSHFALGWASYYKNAWESRECTTLVLSEGSGGTWISSVYHLNKTNDPSCIYKFTELLSEEVLTTPMIETEIKNKLCNVVSCGKVFLVAPKSFQHGSELFTGSFIDGVKIDILDSSLQPISSGLFFAARALDACAGSVQANLEGNTLRYGQAIRAKTAAERRGW
jgi:tRNA threonylcarbamoyl adenosine modification protein YeaZ